MTLLQICHANHAYLFVHLTCKSALPKATLQTVSSRDPEGNTTDTQTLQTHPWFWAQVLGSLLLGSGVLAAAGSRKRSTHLMTASLTISCLGTLLAFEFTAEVRRALPCTCAASHCTLATSKNVDRLHRHQHHCTPLPGSTHHIDSIPQVCCVLYLLSSNMSKG